MNALKRLTAKKLTIVVAIATCCLGIISCSNSQNSALNATPPETAATNHSQPESDAATSEATVAASPQAEANPTKQASSQQPTIGTVKAMVAGDLLCYVTLVDENNVEHNVGADFEICANEDTFLNRKVSVSYEAVPVNDCQSAEPCGRTRIESIITQMAVVGAANPGHSGNSKTISNGEWTIAIGNIDSWSGVNGTGNLSYRGCDAEGNCLSLTGGTMTCRNGICTTVWRNGSYSYSLQEPIDNPDRPTHLSTTLTVRKGSEVILEATGFNRESGSP